MKFGLDIPIKNEFSNPHTLIETAIEAENAGWDGLFLWDTYYDTNTNLNSILDPWIAISAIAAKTENIKLGLLVTPLARRRPWKVAKEMVTLDHLSKGRMIFGVGLGFGEKDFIPFGESFNVFERAEKLDESLEIITKLWSGEEFSYEGKHFNLKNVQFLPSPFQKPRIPIWTGGLWPNKKPMRRASKYDGVYLGTASGEKMNTKILKEAGDYILKHRNNKSDFDIAVYGITPMDRDESHKIVEEFKSNGATWWVEGNERSYKEYREKIRIGIF
jgi:alkanesulfonate monooxygenase SsuD/methylene tetrahydromethanopterin reductase-like flavin-dependent oxidoreductase (luciferase family)